jgi:hypothetical protein
MDMMKMVQRAMEEWNHIAGMGEAAKAGAAV